jgi:hypothetical protein
MHSDQNMHEVYPLSYWGALASILLFNAVGYFIFQSFVENITSSVIIPLLFWFFIFFSIERAFFGRIKTFLNDPNRVAKSIVPKTFGEVCKIIITLALLAANIWLALGHFPFERTETTWWAPLLFNIFCLGVSYFLALTQVKSLKTAGGCVRIVGILGCSLFIVVGIFFENVRYIAGVIGLETVSFLVVSWLLED